MTEMLTSVTAVFAFKRRKTAYFFALQAAFLWWEIVAGTGLLSLAFFAFFSPLPAAGLIVFVRLFIRSHKFSDYSFSHVLRLLKSSGKESVRNLRRLKHADTHTRARTHAHTYIHTHTKTHLHTRQ